MTDQELLDRGYKQYKPSPLCHKSIEACFQKRFDDDVGKKYFITVKKWEAVEHPYTHEKWGPTYEYDVQLYDGDRDDERNAIDLLFHSSWEVDKVEECMEKLFETGLFGYYEKWEEC